MLKVAIKGFAYPVILLTVILVLARVIVPLALTLPLFYIVFPAAVIASVSLILWLGWVMARDFIKTLKKEHP